MLGTWEQNQQSIKSEVGGEGIAQQFSVCLACTRCWVQSPVPLLEAKIQTEANAFRWFPLPLDESVSVSNTIQSFIWGVNAGFEVPEELICMNSFGVAVGENIFK